MPSALENFLRNTFPAGAKIADDKYDERQRESDEIVRPILGDAASMTPHGVREGYVNPPQPALPQSINPRLDMEAPHKRLDVVDYANLQLQGVTDAGGAAVVPCTLPVPSNQYWFIDVVNVRMEAAGQIAIYESADASNDGDILCVVQALAPGFVGMALPTAIAHPSRQLSARAFGGGNALPFTVRLQYRIIVMVDVDSEPHAMPGWTPPKRGDKVERDDIATASREGSYGN